MNSLLFLIISQSFAEDYYKLLDVDKFADEKAIRKSFKKLSLDYHPDRGNTQDFYMKLSLAYEVLTNPAKREIYDKFGEEGISVGGLKYNVEEIYDNYFGIDYPGKQTWWNLLYQNTKVIEITEQTIHFLNDRSEMWMVQFYGTRSKKSREYTGIWNNLANRMDSLCKFAAVNCDLNEEFCRSYSIRKYPVIYKLSENVEEEPVQYEGLKDYKTLSDYIISNLPGKVDSLNISNIRYFLSNQPEKPKIILFTDSKEHIPTLKVLSKELENQVLFGEVRNTQASLLEKYEISSFPTVASIHPIAPDKLSGSYTKNSLAGWVKRVLKDHETGTLARELNLDVFDQGNCNKNDTQFCFISFSPDLQMREVLNELVESFKKDPVSFFWVDSKVYPQVLAETRFRSIIVRGKKAKFTPVQCVNNGFSCFREALVSSLNGAREFIPLRSELKFRIKNEL